MRGQQVEGSDSSPQLYSHEIPPGMLHPALVFPVQERHVRVGPEERQENGLEHLSCEDRLTQLGFLGLVKRARELMLLHF